MVVSKIKNSKPGAQIHATAIVSPRAEIEEGVQIGPYAVIGDNVTIREGTLIGPHTLVEGPTSIGKRNRILGHASIGTPPQDLKYKGEETCLIIGDGNVIREFVTLNRGTSGGGGKTTIGHGNLLMTGTHIAHDCHIGNETIMANAATLAGHVEIGDFSTVGAFTGVHQFCRVGRYAFIGGYSVVTRDALPFIKTVGDRNQAKIYGINSVGLERRGISKERIESLKKAYRLLFQKRLKVKEAIAQIRSDGLETEDVKLLIEFIETSERGYIR